MTALFGFLIFVSFLSVVSLTIISVSRKIKNKPANKRIFVGIGISFIAIFVFAAVGNSFYTDAELAAMAAKNASSQASTNTEGKTEQQPQVYTQQPTSNQKETDKNTANQTENTENQAQSYNETVADASPVQFDSTPNTSAAVDEIISKAKIDAEGSTPETRENALKFIAENIESFENSNETMEQMMYYGSLLEYGSKNDDLLNIGEDAVQAVKYVYRGAETVDDSATQENIKQVKDGLAKLAS